MIRNPDESASDFQKRVLDPISPTFCAAKWYNATIWLSSGQTASCHHPLPHSIDPLALEKDPSSLHNTDHKKARRQEMLRGQWPKECEYCALIEGKTKASVSDRVSQSDFYFKEDIEQIAKAPWNQNVAPKVLEIAFDRTCNMACSYCNPGYSTRWSADLQKNGPYQNLQSDGARAYQQKGNWAESATELLGPGPGAENPYTLAFWRWWPELRKSLIELRVTGGEPLLSVHFKKFLQLLRDQPPRPEMLFSLNSNLAHPWSRIEEFLNSFPEGQRLGIYTSCEAQGSQAEYIRDGLDYSNFFLNLKKILDRGKVERLQLMSTVSALSLFSLTDFMDELIILKKEFGQYLPSISMNIVRFPSFMSPSVLPLEIRQERAEHFEKWLAKVSATKLFWHAEIDGIERLISYLREVSSPHDRSSSLELRQQDFRSFFEQYDLRRGKNFSEVFPSTLVEWYKSIPRLKLESNAPQFFEANAAKGYHEAKNV